MTYYTCDKKIAFCTQHLSTWFLIETTLYNYH